MTNHLQQLTIALEISLALTGAVLLWRLVLSRAARAEHRATPLPAWDLPVTEFLGFLILVLLGGFAAAAGAGYGARALGWRGDAATVSSGAAAQLGMLAGVGVFRFFREQRPFGPRLASPGLLASGGVTFLISLPLMLVSAKLWELLLELFGLPTERQDLISMFANAESPLLLAVMMVLAVVIAPCTEELVFRAGLFRYLRTRIPRPVALVLPALFFALLHVNWQTLQGLASLAPLVVLAVTFSLAYERTGRIGTSIMAHACFNLNTILVIFSGLNL